MFASRILCRLAKSLYSSRSALLALGLLLVTRAEMLAQVSATVTNCYSIPSGDTNYQPPLVQGSDGNFYGTTPSDGASGDGTVFRLTPDGTFTTIYNFDGPHGANPQTGVVQGSDGNFYGLTLSGGSKDGGVFYKITPSGALTVLRSTTLNEGDLSANLVLGPDGNFYGAGGGEAMFGTFFRLTPSGVLTNLHSFSASEGGSSSDVILGSDGNFYGATTGSSRDSRASGYGSVYRMTAAGDITILYSFNGTDGSSPDAGVTEGSDGNFYGITNVGGTYGHGTIFRLTPGGDLTVLHQSGASGEGYGVVRQLALGQDGNFYQTTVDGGTYSGGTAFQITPSGTYTTIYNFQITGAYVHLYNSIIAGSDGNFYGSSDKGGDNNRGTIFKLTVNTPHPAFFTGESALANGVYYLAFPNSNIFGYYSYLSDARYIYHFDLGYEYVFDAADGHGGVYLYDFASNDFFYSSPVFPFPYLYDFNLESFLYYFPDPNHPGHYNTDGVRYFYNFTSGAIIAK